MLFVVVESAVGSPQQGENRSSVSIQKLRETVEALEEENQQVSLLTHQTRESFGGGKSTGKLADTSD